MIDTNQRKLCNLYMDGDNYIVALTEEQIALVNWIIDKGYDFKLI